ncbi:MAG: STAS domain-containing protein [Gemmatales bacterium]|nr:STAS domain-containing protein [Gemmatales bacterium]MDW8387791.1 STAS domain-containing protein [Gemmatales bacterium]
MNPKEADQSPVIEIERHGDIAIITPASEVESMSWELMPLAAEIVLAPLKREPASAVIVDLSRVTFFGSMFLSLLLRCHTLVKQQGGEMVICNVSDQAQDLLRLTNLDTLWALYDSREEAIEALS